jgi:diguanylate cyclase (GGDEF)-like protein
VRSALVQAFLLGDVPIPRDEPVTRASLRLRIAAHDYPRILLYGAVILVVFSMVNLVTSVVDKPVSHAIDACVAVFLVLTAWLMAQPRVSPQALPWLFTAATTIAITGLMVQVLWENEPVAYGYGLIAMCFVGAATLAWRPFLVGAAILTTVAAAVTVNWDADDPADWIVAWLASVALSSVLLRLRLRSVDALADAIATARSAAVTDELTGLLNRRGLQEAGLALVRAHSGSVFAVFVDIAGLKSANDQYGHEFGDSVIRGAARCVAASARGTDVVARWGGDEFVVLGPGGSDEAEAVRGRLAADPIGGSDPRAAWDGGLSVGYAVADGPDADLDALLTRADADMYQRRGR